SSGASPLTSTLPALGRSRSAMTRNSVVLPQPDGPMKETNSPAAIARSTLLSASTLPSAVSKVSDTPRASTASAADAEGASTFVLALAVVCMGTETCLGLILRSVAAGHASRRMAASEDVAPGHPSRRPRYGAPRGARAAGTPARAPQDEVRERDGSDL